MIDVILFFRVYDGYHDAAGTRQSARFYLRVQMPALLSRGDDITIGGWSLTVSHRGWDVQEGASLSMAAIYTGPEGDTALAYPSPAEIEQRIRDEYAAEKASAA